MGMRWGWGVPGMSPPGWHNPADGFCCSPGQDGVEVGTSPGSWAVGAGRSGNRRYRRSPHSHWDGSCPALLTAPALGPPLASAKEAIGAGQSQDRSTLM